MADIDVTKHVLVPKHAKLSEKERKEILEKYGVNTRDLPKINIKDPAIAKLDVKEGDIIKILRNSPNAGETAFYRRVSSV